MDTTDTAADFNTNNDNKAACSTEHISSDGESSSVVIVEERKKSKGSIGLLTQKIRIKIASSKSDPGVREEASAMTNITQTLNKTTNTTGTAADSNTNNDNKAACSTEHIGSDGESSSVVIVEEMKKSKGSIGLLTRKIKIKMASSKSNPDNKGTGGDPSCVLKVEETKKSPRHFSSHTLHHMLKKAGKKKSSKSSSEHEETASDSTTIVMVEQPSKSSAKQFLNLTFMAKKPGKKHSSKSKQDLLDFSQNLELGYLAEASQQLLDREKGLFNLKNSSSEVICTEGDTDDLKKDYDILMDHLKKAVYESFNIDNEKMLRSAIIAIVEQEEQDKFWEEAAEEAPSWRPMRCHDTIVKKVVKERLQQIDNEDNNDPDILKTEVVRIGNVIQNDLLQVVRHVQRCYSECYSDFNVCNMYAQLYHQAFSTTLRKLRQYSTTIEDYRFILQQINSFSKDILNQDELNPHINIESLEALLPVEDYKALEKRYLLHKENEIKSWLSNALKLKEADWQANKKPELIDEYYICDLALDAIGVVEGGIKEVKMTLGNDKSQGILLQMDSFIRSYKNSMEEFLKNQEMDLTAIVKSQLFNIIKLRDYIENQEELPDEIKTAWLSTVSELRDSCHSYLLIPIHKELMAAYRKLWTPAWFSEHEVTIDKLEDALNEKIDSFNDLHHECKKELLSQLHFEVMIEYVRRMLKRKLKLQNKGKQEAAADFLHQDSQRISRLFREHGSEKEWLSEILPRVSEVIKIQDPDGLQLEICALLKHHPDLSAQQIFQLLKLKSRCPDARMVRECYHQTINNVEVSEPNPVFFCHVPRNISMTVCSCLCMFPFYLNEALPCRK